MKYKLTTKIHNSNICITATNDVCIADYTWIGYDNGRVGGDTCIVCGTQIDHSVDKLNNRRK